MPWPVKQWQDGPAIGYEGGMDASYPIRPIGDSELPAFGQVTDQAFNSNYPAEELVRLDRLVFEPERTLVAFDGDRMVGTTLAFSFGLTVPGGEVVGAAGISGVSVLPTHRRRGILSALMRRQIADIAAGGEPLAALNASESAIYGRYGYGSAADWYSFTLHRGAGGAQAGRAQVGRRRAQGGLRSRPPHQARHADQERRLLGRSSGRPG